MKKDSNLSLKAIFVLIVLCNLVYAYFYSGNYDNAIERSYFQGLAILTVWFLT